MIVFTATMSWAANVDGIHFLLDEVFPLLLQARPEIKAVIIGRNPPAALTEKVKERGLNVVLTGFVDDIRPYVAAANVYVIPLFVGSGTRIKAFEAMAMGRPVVSTTLGVEGLDVTDSENYLRADDAVAFARKVYPGVDADDAAMRARLAPGGTAIDGRAVFVVPGGSAVRGNLPAHAGTVRLRGHRRGSFRNTISGIRKNTNPVAAADTMIRGARCSSNTCS